MVSLVCLDVSTFVITSWDTETAIVIVDTGKTLPVRYNKWCPCSSLNVAFRCGCRYGNKHLSFLGKADATETNPVAVEVVLTSG